jgi:cysteine-rich repeat protein
VIDGEGRLEMFRDGAWGTICDSFWGLQGAQVACRELGYLDGVAALQDFGGGEGAFSSTGLACDGTEDRLRDCMVDPNDLDCGHAQDVGVRCATGLEDGACAEDTHCSDDRVCIDRHCAVLACGDGDLDEGEECDDGNRANGDGCDAGCQREVQDGDVRLTDGAAEGEGRLEVYYDSQWGTVCGDNWRPENQNADRSCQLLGFRGWVSSRREAGAPADAPIWLDALGCAGDEASLFDCAHNAIGVNDCTHADDIALVCLVGEGVEGAACRGATHCNEGLACVGRVCAEPACGDRQVQAGEQCDDGNLDAGDGCDADCMNEETCGNGEVEGFETCDDGNLDSADGCDSRCTFEDLQIRGSAEEHRGRVAAGEADLYYFTVEHTPSHFLAFTSTDGDSTCNYLAAGDTIIELYPVDAEGGLGDRIAVDDDGGLAGPDGRSRCSRIERVLDTGSYALRVIAFRNTALTDYYVDLETWVDVDAGGDFAGGFRREGHDHFRFTVDAETQMTFETSDGVGGCPANSVIRVNRLSADGQWGRAGNDNGGGGGQCPFLRRNLTPGDYMVEVIGRDDRAVRDYVLSVRYDVEPVCGNGHVETEEGCDDGNDDLLDGCNACALIGAPRQVFVTSDTHRGGGLGGLVGADAICAARAQAAGLAGVYMAWLSDATDSPSTRFTQSLAPYVRVDGEVVADSWADLTTQGVDVTLSVDENGAAVGHNRSNGWAWSDTNADGTGRGRTHCENWSNLRAQGNKGDTGSLNLWSTVVNPGSFNCISQPARLYCFEQ